MKQATIVMFYGPKPSCLATLIATCQEQVAHILGNCFHPYDIGQVHATLVSLEQVPGSAGFNRYFYTYRNQMRPMDVSGLLNFLRKGGHFPLRVQIGGFQKKDYPFTSQGQRPYERSFSIVGVEAAIPLLVGWPVLERSPASEVSARDMEQESEDYPTTLDKIRRSVQAFNVIHRYHRTPTDIDNDFYFRIGLLHQPFPGYELRKKTEGMLREHLRTVQPIIVDITAADLSIISYRDETLPLASTQAWQIHDIKVTPDFILSLYQ